MAFDLYMSQKRSSGQIFRVTIVYQKENSKIKDTFSRKFLCKNMKNLIFGPKMGGLLIHRINLYMGK